MFPYGGYSQPQQPYYGGSLGGSNYGQPTYAVQPGYGSISSVSQANYSTMSSPNVSYAAPVTTSPTSSFYGSASLGSSNSSFSALEPPAHPERLDNIETGTYVITKHGKPARLVDGKGWEEVDEAVATSGPDRGAPIVVTTRVSLSSAKAAKEAVVNYSEDIINESRTTGTVPRLFSARKIEIAALVAEVEADLKALEARINVDDQCDREPIAAKIASLLPPVTELGDGNAQNSKVGAANDYLDLRTLLDDLARRVKHGVDEEFVPFFQIVIEKGEQCYVALQNTRNAEVEAEMVAIIRRIVVQFDKYMKLQFPDGSDAHSQSVAVDGDCVALEKQRTAMDWSQALMDTESSTYVRVAEVLKEVNNINEEATESLKDLEGFVNESLDARMYALAKAAQDEENRLKTLADGTDKAAALEAEKYAKLRSDLVAAAVKSSEDQETKVEAVRKAAAEARAAVAALKKAQEDLWEEEKRESLFRVAAEILDQRHNSNLSEAGDETEAIGLRLLDALAAINSGRIAHELVDEVTNSLHKFETSHREVLLGILVTLLTDKIKLHVHQYFKTALALFAANSRIEIKEQEKKAMIVKKERRNVAQDIQGVDECTRAVAAIEAAIRNELEIIEALKVDLKAIARERQEAHDRLTTLSADNVKRRNAAHDLDVAFKDTITQLKTIEEEKHRSLFLTDLLDAAFL